jgi:TonB-linked SusC/RagA family outer membrane protein
MENNQKSILGNRKLILRFLLIIFLTFLSIPSIYAQSNFIRGIVVDEKGEPLMGVSVIVKTVSGTTTGTITSFDGTFSVKADKDVPLVISYIGYKTLKVMGHLNQQMRVAMEPDAKMLDEYVVVGFGSQKKVNLTGAVTTVNASSLVSANVSNISTALVGNAPGISGLQASGEPGRNATSLFIRGRATFDNGAANPLIVIDGVEQPSEQAYMQLNAMDPNEIASVSVLKDASSTAVYGIRGANGVIIVNTKRGTTGKPVIHFSANYGFTKPTNLPKPANSYNWAVLRNEAINIQKNQFGDSRFDQYLFSETDLWKFKNGRDYTDDEINAMSISDEQKERLRHASPLWYGSRDLMDEQFNNSGPQSQLNFNVSGGNDIVKYFVSLGYFHQGSIVGNAKWGDVDVSSKYNRYNFRSSVELHPLKSLDISIVTAGQFGTTTGAAANTSTTNDALRYKSMMGYALGEAPLLLPLSIEGHVVSECAGIVGSEQNPLGIKLSGGDRQISAGSRLLTSGQGILYNTLLTTTIKITHRLDYLLKGLSVSGTFNYDDYYTKTVTINRSVPVYTVTRDLNDPNKYVFYGGQLTSTDLNTNASLSTWNKTYFDIGANYNKTINDHHFTLLALWKASLYKLPTTGGFNTPSGIVGFVGRATYSYMDKYLAEYSMGYNGTEQFAKGHRFGFFPALSLGWVISNESFMKKAEWIDLLKLRASYGKVGSDYLGGRRYLYLPSSYANYGGYYWGSNSTSANPGYGGLAESSVGNPAITWEKSTKMGAGIDARFFKERLFITLDAFREKRENILVTSDMVSATYGVAAANIPPVNVGKTTNHGYEITLGWNDKIHDFEYNIAGSLSYAHNTIDFKAEVPQQYAWMNATGYSIGQYKGLVSDGFYNTQEELQNAPYNTYSSGKQTLGDIRYKDINGDGLIDVKDMVPIGYNNLPEYSYNFKMGFKYKGFDVNLLFVGTKNGDYLLQTNYKQMLFKTSGVVWQYQVDGRWTADKVAKGESITYPRSQIDFSSTPNFVASDFWLKSTDFLRLKNIEIGYNLPSFVLHNFGIQNLRIYANANNLWTSKTDLDKYGIDPETADQSSEYLFPLTRAIVFGVNVTF